MNEQTVASIAEFVGGQIEGDSSLPIREVADVRHATATDVAFIRDGSFAHLAKETGAGALFVTELIETSVTQIVVEDAHAAFAKIALLFHPVPTATEHDIHPSAIVHESAKVDSPVVLGPNVVVGAGSKIGARTSIQATSVIGENVTIGTDCTIYPRVVIYPNVLIGDEVVEKDGTRNKFPQLGGLIIGNRVEIGANSTVDRGALTATSIGAGTKIDNLCHIAHNCKVGNDCGISALAALGGGVQLGDRVVLGGHVTSAGNITLADDVIVGGNSGITSDVKESGVYLGLPLLPIARGRRSLILLKRLPELAAEIKALRHDVDELS